MDREKLTMYFKNIFPVTLLLFLSQTIFFLVFKFLKLNFEGYKIASKIVFFIYISYIFFSILIFKKSQNYREKYYSILEKNKFLENKLISDRNDLENYFLLWVHQMKTPITSSKLIIDSNLYNKDFLKLKRDLISIEDYTNMALNYLKLTNSLTDMYIYPLKLDDVIKEKIKKYSSLFISKKISIYYNKIENEVITDAKWFSVLFEQILSNAIKYTQNGEIRIIFNESENCLEVIDTGIGISKEDLPKIFDKGYSGFNGKMNEKSTGLGLFLVKEIAEKLSISIKVSSEIGKGSAFKIYFLEKKRMFD